MENTAEEEIEMAAVVRAGQEERDRQLQAEIRALESETIRLERQWRARAEAEEKSVLATVAVEEDYLQVRQQRGQRGQQSGGGGDEDMADLVVQREQLIQQLQAVRAQSERTAQEEQEVTAEIRTYREGVAAHRARISDKQEQHRLNLRELQLESGPKLRELREQVGTIAAQIKDGAERCRRQVVTVDKDHAVELAKLDSQVSIFEYARSIFICDVPILELRIEQVKSEVGRREDEIENLRDAVEAENTKIVRLERLIKQYSSSENAAAPPAVTATERRAQQDFSSNRSTASSYISAGSTTIGSGRGADSTRGAGVRASAARNVNAERSQASSRPNTGTRIRSTSSATAEQAGMSTRTATASAVADGLQRLRLNRTTGSRPAASARPERDTAAMVDKEDGGDDFENNIDVAKSISYDLSDDEEPLPVPSWMKPSKY